MIELAPQGRGWTQERLGLAILGTFFREVGSKVVYRLLDDAKLVLDEIA